MFKINKCAFLFCAIALILSSCGTKYSINGNTDVTLADGNKIYLRTFEKDDLKVLDSCDVVHGQFAFSGSTDTVKLAYITIETIMVPVLLEEGEIKVTLDSKTGMDVSGTQYNDQFNDFRKKLIKIEGELQDLDNKHLQGIKNGENEDSLILHLTQEQRVIIGRREDFVKKFICDNFDNPLAAAAFQDLTIYPLILQGGYAELPPWIDEILTKANESFKKDPYVKFYVNRAKEVEGIMNGTIEVPGQQPQQQPQQEQQTPQPNQQEQETSQQQNTQPAQQEDVAEEGSDERLKELEGTIPTPNQLAEPAKK